MRELVLDKLDEFRHGEQGFDKNTMRWARLCWSPYGVQSLSRKEAKKYGFKHLSETSRDDFKQMTDENLLNLLQVIIRQCSKQM